MSALARLGCLVKADCIFVEADRIALVNAGTDVIRPFAVTSPIGQSIPVPKAL
jgi:hypothetical protein